MSDAQAPDRQKGVEPATDPEVGRRRKSDLFLGLDGPTGNENPADDTSHVQRLMRTLSRALSAESRYGHGVLWFPVAMALGAALWFVAETEPSFVLLISLVMLSMAGCWFLHSHPKWQSLVVLLCGFLVGMIAADVETKRVGTALLDGPVTTRIEGIVLARDIDDRGRWRYTLRLLNTRDPRIGRPPERIRVLARSRHDPINLGEQISGLARLQPPSGPALPGGYDFAFNSYFRGLGAIGYFFGRPERLTNEAQTPARNYRETFSLSLAKLREKIAFRMRAALPGDAGAFASALAVADRRAMSPESVEALRASGLAHVLAISGLHMALVAGGVFFALRAGASLLPMVAQAMPIKKYAAVISLIVATSYLLISGASVSTQRAWLMLAIVLLAVVFDRPALTLRNVALAAICIIIITPSAVLGPGFQMSFAATAALVSTYAWWRERSSLSSGRGDRAGWLQLGILFFVGLAVTSLVAGLATAPFATYHFHRTAAFGLIANLAAMPVVTLVVMPAGLLSVLSMPLGLEYWPLQLMGLGLRSVLFVARSVQDLGGYLTVGRVGETAIVAMTAGFLILVLMRSWLRMTGVMLIAATLLVLFMFPSARDPLVLVSEDGRQVALVGKDQMATNRTRPSKFIFEQWQRALRRDTHVAPKYHAGDAEGSAVDWLEREANNPVAKDAAGFRCIRKKICLGRSVSGAFVAVVEDLTLLGAACDVADIVITSRAIEMSACRSGAVLVTGRMLRQSGAIEIYAKNAAHQLRIEPSVHQTNRPWTVHRHYDWRSRSFSFDRPAWSIR